MKKIKKYIFYAIGEIILVMLGILFAMQINNWNENRKTKNLANEYFAGIRLDLQKDTSVFNQAIRFIEEGIEYKKDALISIQLDTFPVGDLISMSNGFYFNIKMNDATFLNMRNSNLESVLSNRKVYDAINNYYIFKQDYLDNFSEWEVEISKKESAFWEKQKGIEMAFTDFDGDTIPILQDNEVRKAKIIEATNSIEGRNMNKLSLHKYQGTLIRYQGEVDEANKLIKLLDKKKTKKTKK